MDAQQLHEVLPLILAQARYVEAPLEQVQASAIQPRSQAQDGIAGLRRSLEVLLVQPPLAEPDGNGGYRITDGERRLHAVREQGAATVPLLVRDEPLPPLSRLLVQILANEHREPLDPFDQAAAYKALWYACNAWALSCGEAVGAALAEAESLGAALPAMRAALDEAGFSANAPAISQETMIAALGLGMSKAALRKQLEILAADDATQQRARALGLSAASMRSLLRLTPEDQDTLLTAMEADPGLVSKARSIVEGVNKKGRSIADAIAIVQGRIPGDDLADAPASGGSQQVGSDDAGADAGASGDTETDGAAVPVPVPASSPEIDEMAAMDAILPLIETVQQLQDGVQALLRLCDDDLTRLPEVWAAYIPDAVGLLYEAIAPLVATIEGAERS